MRSVSSRGVSELALTENELKAIRIPVRILVGDRDPMRRMYAVPLQKVRNDWRVVEIQGAGHLNCIFKRRQGFVPRVPDDGEAPHAGGPGTRHTRSPATRQAQVA